MDKDKLFRQLKRKKIDLYWFETKEEAADFISSLLSEKKIVFGGSMTLKQCGMYEKLSENNEVFWHWHNNDIEARRKAELEADVYMASLNGISETGELISIDGSCNRLSNSMYGNDTVIFVAGVNKVFPTTDEAIHHARNVAAPMNARRVGVKTPCAAGEMRCHDCSSEARICSVMSIIWQKPIPMKKMMLVLINENLGY
jgi:L-lactate utilization protein LutB